MKTLQDARFALIVSRGIRSNLLCQVAQSARFVNIGWLAVVLREWWAGPWIHPSPNRVRR